MNALLVYIATIAALLLGAGILHLIARLGRPGRRISDWLCHAPALDVVVFYFTALPAIVGVVLAGWAGLGAAIGGQCSAMLLWVALHELAHPAARKEPRIFSTINQLVGRWRNHFALWWTAWAVPGFWAIRLGQYLVYPPLTWTVRLPKYRSRDWVNLSRHKFRGLVGYDLIWCLYCDWMTGVWSLSAEMLRNVESFWCPIRFDSTKKCEHCQVDYPDIAGGWIGADGTMQDVTALLQEKYPAGQKSNPWFGHPARLTIEGEEPETSSNDT